MEDLERLLEGVKTFERNRSEGRSWGLILGIPRWGQEFSFHLISDLHEIPHQANQVLAIRLFLARLVPVAVLHIVRRPFRVWVFCEAQGVRKGFFGRILPSGIRWKPLKENQIPSYFFPSRWVS